MLQWTNIQRNKFISLALIVLKYLIISVILVNIFIIEILYNGKHMLSINIYYQIFLLSLPNERKFVMINEYIKIRNKFKDCVALVKSGIFYYTYDNDMYLKSKISYKGYLSFSYTKLIDNYK